MRALNRLICFLPLLLLACSGPRQFVVLHTSDAHGRIAGYAVLKAISDKEKLPHVVLDSGDIFQGTPEGNLTKGEAVIAAMNAVGYAAMAIGNHEYDYGEANLERLARLADFPMLGANITRKADGRRPGYAGTGVMLTVGEVKVGVVGIATHHTPTSTMPQNVAHLAFNDEVVAAREETRILRDEGAEVVIILSHCGLAPSVARKRTSAAKLKLTEADEAFYGDADIARGAGADMIMGGHMHTGLDAPWVDPESRIPIIQSFENLVAASRVVVTVSGDGVEVSGHLVELDPKVHGEDATVKAITDRVFQEVGKTLDGAIGTATAPLSRKDHKLDNPLGSWMADVMREAMGTDVGLQNSYGIRDDLPAGPITLRGLYKVMPFENTLTIVELSGAELTDLMRASLKGGKSAMQISGMTVVLDGEDLAIEVGGQAIEPNRRYRITTNNYLTSGGSKPLKKGFVEDTGRSIREVLEAHVRKIKTIRPPATGRIVIRK